MHRPYIICHMVTSIDGKVTGDFLYTPECESATEVYYELNREYNKSGAHGFICGRVTMESSFTGGWYPNLTKYALEKNEDLFDNYLPDEKEMSGFYAVAFDPKGKLGWKSNTIIDDDPGYGGAQIIEVLTRQADPRYLCYLREMKIPYIIAGKTEIDVLLALRTLADMGIKALILEGGSIVNGYFNRADVIDEISLVVAPIVAGKDDKPLFMESALSNYKVKQIRQKDEALVINYVK